ncbi:serine hydrolase domain-containing protein [Brevibacterium album]|uniref:serine hydrolase domain-containing protein n=1 Tax=Brevibacterium album TaxID=417948 RepID=UPI00041D28C8|nr:serine hydrolase domain-containing protein [Brevibacterium album]
MDISRTPRRRTPLLIALTAAAAAALVLTAVAPVHRTLPAEAHGDAALLDEVAAAVEPGAREALTAALIGPDGTVRTGGRGADAHTAFEIASLTKTFTAALFADAVERGEVEPETTLGELVPEVTGEAAEVPLVSLATHTSGLPRLGFAGPLHMVRTFAAPYYAGNPYAGIDEGDLVTMLNRASVTPGQGFEYSNLGFDALGLAVARAAGAPYRELLETRILAPLGMHETVLLETAGDVPAHAAAGYTATGDRSAYWWSGAASPSGALMSTVHDLTLYARALLDGSAPGASAMEPQAARPGGGEVGYAWHIEPAGAEGDSEEVGRGSDRQTVTWHNGMNGGFASVLGLGADGSAIIVLSSTAVDVTGALDLVEAPGAGDASQEANTGTSASEEAASGRSGSGEVGARRAGSENLSAGRVESGEVR